jgi:hypothetical protein
MINHVIFEISPVGFDWKKFNKSGHLSKAKVNNETLLKLCLDITMVIFKHNQSYVIS